MGNGACAGGSVEGKGDKSFKALGMGAQIHANLGIGCVSGCCRARLVLFGLGIWATNEHELTRILFRWRSGEAGGVQVVQSFRKFGTG